MAGTNKPGTGLASSPNGTPQHAEIYNPKAAAGARFSGGLLHLLS